MLSITVLNILSLFISVFSGHIVINFGRACVAFIWKTSLELDVVDKKLSYRRETARQLPTWREGGVRPSSPLSSAPSGYTYAYG